MRHSASENLEIIQLIEQSPLPVKRTLEKLGVPKATFYRWCDLYQSGGPEAAMTFCANNKTNNPIKSAFLIGITSG